MHICGGQRRVTPYDLETILSRKPGLHWLQASPVICLFLPHTKLGLQASTYLSATFDVTTGNLNPGLHYSIASALLHKTISLISYYLFKIHVYTMIFFIFHNLSQCVKLYKLRQWNSIFINFNIWEALKHDCPFFAIYSRMLIHFSFLVELNFKFIY